MLLNVLLMQYRAPSITQTKSYLTQMLVILELRNPALNGGFPGSASGKVPACQYRSHRRRGFHPWVGKIPWERKRQPAPVFLPGDPMDRGAWRATVHGVAKSQTRLN